MIAFAITMPSFSKAFQKTKGKLFPFGWWHLMRASKNNDSAQFYLIGIDPKFQGKGVTALIFSAMFDTFHRNNIDFLETNPELAQKNNVRDFATIHELTVLSNLESHNAQLIKEGKEKEERFKILQEIAEYQLKVLSAAEQIKNLRAKISC